MGTGDLFSSLEKLRGPRRLHPTKVFRLAHKRQPGMRMRGEPVEQLDQLQLVIEVMLEPEHYLLVRAGCAASLSSKLFWTSGNELQPHCAMNAARSRESACRSRPARTGPSCRTSRQGRKLPWTACVRTSTAKSPLVTCSTVSRRGSRRPG